MALAAMNFVTATYEGTGWTVEDVHKENLGYDLRCRKENREERVEVKGVSGDRESFHITANEVEQAKLDPKWMLCVVLNALTTDRTCVQYSGKAFIDRFDLQPISFRAEKRN